MTIEEMSNEFDNELFKLYETGVSNIPLQLDEYEKSIYLTKAQEAIVDSLYSEFDASESIRRQLHNLICMESKKLEKSANPHFKYLGYVEYHYIHEGKDTIKAILSEYAVINTKCASVPLPVIPVKQDDINRVIQNPFRTANNNRLLRIEGYEDKAILDIIGKDFNVEDNSIEYHITYLRTPKPIILMDFSNDKLTINGISKNDTIDLPEDLHRKIIEIAVNMVVSNTNNKKSKSTE